MAQETPDYVTKAKRMAWQPYVNQQIRRLVHRGESQDTAVERALDLRDARIRSGDKPPQFGKKKR